MVHSHTVDIVKEFEAKKMTDGIGMTLMDRLNSSMKRITENNEGCCTKIKVSAPFSLKN